MIKKKTQNTYLQSNTHYHKQGKDLRYCELPDIIVEASNL